MFFKKIYEKQRGSCYFTVRKMEVKVILLSKHEVLNMTMKSIRYNNADLACLCQ